MGVNVRDEIEVVGVQTSLAHAAGHLCHLLQRRLDL